MKQVNLKDRTRSFALKVIQLVENIPRGRIEDVFSKQLL
jgi:hypothetical protein